MDERWEAKGIEAAAGPEGARTATGGLAAGGAVEVEAKARRRQFSPAYEARILREAEACAGTGQIGALLRPRGCTARA